jgi:hypothetical protein
MLPRSKLDELSQAGLNPPEMLWDTNLHKAPPQSLTVALASVATSTSVGLRITIDGLVKEVAWDCMERAKEREEAKGDI